MAMAMKISVESSIQGMEEFKEIRNIKGNGSNFTMIEYYDRGGRAGGTK